MHNIELELPELVNAREGGTVLQQVIDDWPAKWRAEGQAEVVRRMAARKFGAETAERLAELADPERAAEVGEWLLECESGEELLDRVEGLCESSANGDGAAPG